MHFKYLKEWIKPQVILAKSVNYVEKQNKTRLLCHTPKEEWISAKELEEI